MGKEMNAILGAQAILIWIYVNIIHVTTAILLPSHSRQLLSENLDEKAPYKQSHLDLHCLQ